MPKTPAATPVDLETCSWCCDEVPDNTLTMTDNGRICRACRDEEG